MSYEFHRLNRSWPRMTWWRPLVTGLIAFVFFIVLSVLLAVPVIGVSLFAGDEDGAFMQLITDGTIDNSNPVMLAFTLGSVALMLPAILLATLIMGPRPIGLLSSVEGRLRWGWMSRLILPALVVFVVVLGGYLFLVPPGVAANVEILPATWALLAVTLLLVPLQATAEEYVFRGYLMQLVGTWLKHPAFAILLPVPLFIAGHLYDIWGLLDVGVFAVFAAWLTWRTGGLEAAIVAHVVNNTLLFGIAAFGAIDINASEGDPFGLVVTALTLAAYSYWVVRLHTKRGEARAREVVVDSPASAAVTVDGVGDLAS